MTLYLNWGIEVLDISLKDVFFPRVRWLQDHLPKTCSKHQEVLKLLELHASLRQQMLSHRAHILHILLLLYLWGIMHCKGKQYFLRGQDNLSANFTWRLETASLVQCASFIIQERESFLLQIVSWVQLDFLYVQWVKLYKLLYLDFLYFTLGTNWFKIITNSITLTDDSKNGIKSFFLYFFDGTISHLWVDDHHTASLKKPAFLRRFSSLWRFCEDLVW